MGVKTDADYAELMSIAVKMRQALALMCDGTFACTCTVCRAAWDFDHLVLEWPDDHEVTEVECEVS